MSLFVAIDGVDGAGKTVQTAMLKAKIIENYGSDRVVQVFEPGSTLIGYKIREILLNPENVGMDTTTEFLLFQAARAQLHSEVIEPAVANGKIVLTDRWAWSSMAYQTHGTITTALARQVTDFAVNGQWPDLSVILDVPIEVAKARLVGRKRLDRIERRSNEYFEKCRERYMSFVGDKGVVLVNATRSVGEVHESVWQNFRRALERS